MPCSDSRDQECADRAKEGELILCALMKVSKGKVLDIVALDELAQVSKVQNLRARLEKWHKEHLAYDATYGLPSPE
jgi:hypothetical protein